MFSVWFLSGVVSKSCVTTHVDPSGTLTHQSLKCNILTCVKSGIFFFIKLHPSKAVKFRILLSYVHLPSVQDEIHDAFLIVNNVRCVSGSALETFSESKLLSGTKFNRIWYIVMSSRYEWSLAVLWIFMIKPSPFLWTLPLEYHTKETEMWGIKVRNHFLFLFWTSAHILHTL